MVIRLSQGLLFFQQNNLLSKEAKRKAPFTALASLSPKGADSSGHSMKPRAGSWVATFPLI